MSNRLDTTSTVTLVINGEQSKTSLRDITTALNAVRAARARMNQEEDPARYQELIRQERALTAALANRRREVQQGAEDQKSFFKSFIEGFSTINSLAGNVALGTLMAGWVTSGISAIKSFGMAVVDTYATFEKFQTVLTNALGDASSSRRSLNMLQKFAAETPFSLEELTGSFVKLVNRGIVPTMDDLRKMGDLAASQGKSFDQLTEAILDAVTGEFERLKEFGINATKNGDIVKLSFKGITKEVNNTAEAIQAALLSFGDLQGVGGGMEKMSQTVGGAISNIGDNWNRLLTTIGSNTGGAIHGAVTAINDYLNFLVEAVKSTDQRIQETADAEAVDALARYKQKTPGDQKALYDGTKLELDYYQQQINKKQAELKALSTKRGTADQQDEIQKEIDDLNLNIAKGKAFLETVDADKKLTEDTNAKLAEQKRQKAAEDAAKKAKADAKKAEEERKQTAQALHELAKQYTDFETEQLAATLAANDREVKELENKYDKEIRVQKEGLTKKQINAQQTAEINARVTKLESDKQLALDDLRVKQQKDLTSKIAAYNQQLTQKLATEYDKDKANINARYDAMVQDAGNNADQVALIEKGRAEALADAKINEELRFQEEKAKITADGLIVTANAQDEELARINKKYDDEIVALRAKFSAETQATQEFQNVIDTINVQRRGSLDKEKKKQEDKEQSEALTFAIETAEKTSNAYFEILSRNRQTEADAQIKSLENQKERELSNTDLTEAQRTAINEKYAKQEAEIKRKAWEADKQAAIQQAIINGALAVGKALAQVGPLGAFVIPGIIAETAVQVALISSQKAPEFAKGGIIEGPSHANGGVDMVDTQTGRKIANVEGGEPLMVLSKDTYANNRMLINELLYNSQYRNGAPVKVNTELSTRPASAAFANGGIIDLPRASNSAVSTSGGTIDIEARERLAKLEAFSEMQKKFNKKPVIISRRAWDNEASRVDEDRSAAAA